MPCRLTSTTFASTILSLTLALPFALSCSPPPSGPPSVCSLSYPVSVPPSEQGALLSVVQTRLGEFSAMGADSQCSAALSSLLCSIAFPPCNGTAPPTSPPTRPCISVCLRARDACDGQPALQSIRCSASSSGPGLAEPGFPCWDPDPRPPSGPHVEDEEACASRGGSCRRCTAGQQARAHGCSWCPSLRRCTSALAQGASGSSHPGCPSSPILHSRGCVTAPRRSGIEEVLLILLSATSFLAFSGYFYYFYFGPGREAPRAVVSSAVKDRRVVELSAMAMRPNSINADDDDYDETTQ